MGYAGCTQLMCLSHNIPMRTFCRERLNGPNGFAHVEPEVAYEAFKQHVQHVQQSCDPSRLYVLDIDRKDQTVVLQELCSFLEVSLPGPTGSEQDEKAVTIFSLEQANNTEDMKRRLKEQTEKLQQRAFPFSLLSTRTGYTIGLVLVSAAAGFAIARWTHRHKLLFISTLDSVPTQILQGPNVTNKTPN
eukprot:g73467.t1